MQKVDGQQGKDRTMDSNVMAANAADKHAEYVGGKIKRLGETRPGQKVKILLQSDFWGLKMKS